MRRYNVEVFDRAFNLLDHTNVSEVTWSVDYLSPTKNTITILNCNAHKGDYIRVHDRDSEFFGIITAVKSQSEKLMSVECASFLSVFDMDVLFDTDLQNGTSSLETVLKNLITAMFVSNSDTLQRIPGLSVETTSSTTNWGFNLKSDTEGMHHCIINFYNSLIVRALEKYGVVVTVTPDVQNKAIVLSIGKIADNSRIIETNLPNIVEKNVVIMETEKDVNKLVVYNTANYTSSRSYYLHPDGSYNTTNSNRITPVVQEIKAVSVEEGSTFANAADSEAVNTFGDLGYNNLIELTVANDDTLVKPYELEIGQEVHILSKGSEYKTILTGKTVSDRTQLTFGTVRIDLTKIIKRRYG